ncbi:ABC1 family-domain-containing protein [Schizophyllum commune]
MIRRTASGSENQSSSLMMTEANIGRLVSKLSQMRGAALKLGQFMSIQDTHVLPPDLDAVFRRVQDSAHYMPDAQFETVMREALGDEWMSNFASFERVPFAAASIGQVHRAELKARTIPVAVKVQFPNIARSIASDLGYLRTLLTAGRLLPKGLFLNKTLEVMKGELADECDYTREAGMARKFSGFVEFDNRFMVPWVWSGSTKEVLVMERVNGISIGEERVKRLPKEKRDDIAARVIELCLRELFTWRTMQTDPNWSNFLWDEREDKIQLVDFGATREYSKEFMDSWLRLLQAAASGDRDACVRWSTQVGYLTGAEDEVMVDAHVRSMTLLATPFRSTTPMPVSFGPTSSWADITNQIRALIPTMLKHRLTPPPRETYSLNRKLSGAFLLAARLDATVDTRALWEKVTGEYVFSDGGDVSSDVRGEGKEESGNAKVAGSDVD